MLLSRLIGIRAPTRPHKGVHARKVRAAWLALSGEFSSVVMRYEEVIVSSGQRKLTPFALNRN
jgi:hypothetical protein